MEEIEYNHWKYRVYYDKGNTKFEIEPYPGKPFPLLLSKYYSISSNSITAIRNYQFYVSQPDDFNDIFDSHHSLINFQNITLTTVRKFFNYTERINISKWWHEDKSKLIEFIQHTFYSILLSKIGLICFTPHKYDELMWGYYNNHEGYLIEFDYSKFGSNYNGPFPINYVPKLSPFDINSLGGNLAFLIQSTVKKTKWQHEDEYRFLVEPSENDFKVHGPFSPKNSDLPYQERLVNYPREAIKQVILGFRFLSNENFSILNDNVYEVGFSNGSLLKKELLKVIAERSIPCKAIIQNTKNYMLEDESWTIIPLSEDRFQIRRIEEVKD